MSHRFFARPQRDGLGESEAAARQEGRIFFSRALPTADVNEYLEVSVMNRQCLARILARYRSTRIRRPPSRDGRS
jgi:hypothetical protein